MLIWDNIKLQIITNQSIQSRKNKRPDKFDHSLINRYLTFSKCYKYEKKIMESIAMIFQTVTQMS